MKTKLNLAATSGGKRVRGRFPGFTLIELLTVIAIIGILAAIIIATVGAARRSAARSEAAAKLRNVGMALQVYIEDNRGKFPGPLRGYQKPVRVNTYQLILYIEPYLGGGKTPSGSTVNPSFVSEAYMRWLETSPYNTPQTVSGSDVYVMYSNFSDSAGHKHYPFGEVGVAQPMKQSSFQALFPPSRTRAMWDAQGTERSPAYGELYGKRNVLFHDWHVAAVDPTDL